MNVMKAELISLNKDWVALEDTPVQEDMRESAMPLKKETKETKT